MKRAICLILSALLCLSLTAGAFASSGEASGSAGGGTAIRVSSGSLTTAEGDWLWEGDVPTDAQAVAGFRFVGTAGGQKAFSVSASGHTDPLTDGFDAVLGDERELYAAPNFAEVYDNEGLNPNAEGYDLDYTWIGAIDWDETSPTYGAYTAVTEDGRALLDSILDGAYSTWIEGGTSDTESLSRGPTMVSCSGGAALLVRNAYIYSEGLEGLAISNNGSSGVGSTMVVKDSLLLSRGYVPACATQSENLPNDPLLVTGADRTNLSGGESVTYYYDTAVIVDGWASLSTDGASGDGVDLVAVNTFASALLGGYGTYADGNCRDYFYGSVLEGAEIGIIIAGTGEVSVFDGDEGLSDGVGGAVGLAGDIDPYAFADDDTDYGALPGSVIAGGRYAVMLHTAGSAPVERQGIFYAKDSTLLTDSALLSSADIEYSINASWYGRELSPNIQKYIEYTEGDVILVRGTNAEITLDNVTIQSSNGVLIHSVLNNDTSSPAQEPGTDPVGTFVTLSNMTVTGDILDEDYERPMDIVLTDTTLNGRIVSGTCDAWTDFWLACDYAEDYTIGLASNTFGSEAPLDAFVHTFTMNDDGTYEISSYSDEKGTSLTLAAGSVWNVTGGSSLTLLVIEEGAELNGNLFVDGELVDPRPGRYEGQITLTAADGSACTVYEFDGEYYLALDELRAVLEP